MAPFHNSNWLAPFSAFGTVFGAVFWTVFLAGFLGSPHCVSMCGPIVLNFSVRKKFIFCYQSGRMFSYVIVGGIVGAFGKALLGPDRPFFLTGLTLVSIGALLLFNGYRIATGTTMHLPTPWFFNRMTQALWAKLGVTRLPPPLSATLTGLLTVFLPCGHLYSFLLGAVATGSALKGALFMFAFWLGSAPLLTAGAGWLSLLLKGRDPLAKRRWAGGLLTIAGLASLFSFALRSGEFLHYQKSGTRVPGPQMPASMGCHHEMFLSLIKQQLMTNRQPGK